MTIIENGSIEIIRGTGGSAVSEGKVFEPGDQFDSSNPAASVKRLAGATLREARVDPDLPAACLGVWSGTDLNGNVATIKIWSLEPG